MSRSPRSRRDALAGEGPIVDRARAALRRTAEQFGAVVDADRTSVAVRTRDGIELTLGYDPGNYIFSRVYNLRLTAELPADTAVPGDLELSHRGAGDPRFVRRGDRRGSPAAPGLDALNERIGTYLGRIDLIKAEISGPKHARRLSLVPMGGSYVWVLIPPVFKATAFPAGEPDRILDLVRSLRTWCPAGTGTDPTTRHRKDPS